MKRITVIIPIYNAETKITRCVESIAPQLTLNDEILLINDGSTDNSIEVIRKLEQRWNIVKVIDKQNEGVAKTRNLGIQEAKGEYICFIDNDDFVDGNYFETYYETIHNGSFDLVMGGYRRVTNQKVLFSMNGIESEWYKLIVVAPWAKIYRSKFLKENKIVFYDYSIGEDIYFNFMVYAKTSNIKIIEYSGYNWWFNEDSISNTSQRGFQENVCIEYLMDKLYDITGKQKIYDYFYVRYVIWYLLFSGKNATKKEFMREYGAGMKWLKEKNIAIKFPVFSSILKGEKMSNRWIIFLFTCLHRLKLINLFAGFYCKEENITRKR